MCSATSSPTGARHALISAYRVSLTATASISGDIPSLLQHAYSRHFEEQMSSIQVTEMLIDHARSILADGLPLSMNVELVDDEELPDAMHTLNQGAVWACLVGGGANPDLEDRVLQKAREERPDGNEMHDGVRKALTAEGKNLWFLCRMFFFSLNVAEKDGESYQYTEYGDCYHHRMYMGRLFMLDSANHTALTRARMPRALQSSEFVDPTRLTFPACLKVAELEASLPAWEKHRMVSDVSAKENQTFIVTSVGTVMAGEDSMVFTGPVEEVSRHLFHPVVVPTLSQITSCMHGTVLGWNKNGRLGLGRKNDMSGFEELPFRVDRIIPDDSINVFLSGRRLLFAGSGNPLIAQSGLLPGYRRDANCLTPTPLRFPERVKRFLCYIVVAWASDDLTHLCDYDAQYCVPFEAAEFGRTAVGNKWVDSFCDSTGQWFRVEKVSDGVAELVECEAPTSHWEITPVDVDPWAEL
ncbi:hypothetical protein J8273_8487 [Carpediemonas membranifera]|uniref:Uncharacterized protein n=1 Tax=Carpediemonas membranifera TaxID=201153 RepID=A0A8J6AW90_9EUKA|nr:hypothetical protein J8273_8487 [Carpediemonas membranifera]|eukprot:KAG9389808.1 hypothetical protein J8273_8487 [Carpediemonas membranifera]